jgi:hypothetical protein
LVTAAQGLRNDVKRSGNPEAMAARLDASGVHFAGSLDRFVNTGAAALMRGLRHRRDFGRDEPKDRCVLRDACAGNAVPRASTSTRVETNYPQGCSAAMPLARVYYAVKAEPGLAPVLERLSGPRLLLRRRLLRGVQACLARRRAAPDRISFGNTVKKESAIKAAFEPA